MYDRELALEILTQIYEATQTILKRFEPVKSVEDFTGSDGGMEKLDSICMQLIAVGEGLKNLDKVTNHSLLPKYPQVEWKKAKALRDIISHHYFDVNAEAIHKICQDHMVNLAETIKNIIDDYLIWGNVRDGGDESKTDAPASCPGKLQVPTEEEKEALDNLKSIKERARALKKRLANSELDRANGETQALEKELAQLKMKWDEWEQKRQKATKERMILLGHEKS